MGKGERMNVLLKKTCSGTFTVEAAFIFPILVFLIAFFLQTAILLYSEVDHVAQDVTALRELNNVENFLRCFQMENVKEIILGEE